MPLEKNIPIIKFSNVSKNYRDVQALRNASFSITQGDIFGYIGPNGAGKTTTLKILVGLISDYSGEVKINNELIKNQSNFNQQIGYLPQDVGFQEWRTVDHALITFGRLSGMSKEELQQRIPEVLALVGLVDARKRKIRHLSGGMQQKLKLAQALLHNPSILVLDEPMSGLDPTSRWQMKNTIRQLAQTNVTIVFSSHILEDVEGIATTIGIINQGSVVKIGNPQELQKELVGGNAVIAIGENLINYVDQIKALPVVADVTFPPSDSSQVTIVLKPDVVLDDGLTQLLEFFSSNKIVIRNFNYLKPSLEQVYLKYVMEDPTK